MSSGGRWFGWLRSGAPKIKVHVVLKGRIGEGWESVDEMIELSEGATLKTLLDEADRRGFALREAMEQSRHLKQTLMHNGERCPLPENEGRVLADGDQVYLLSPLAGG